MNRKTDPLLSHATTAACILCLSASSQVLAQPVQTNSLDTVTVTGNALGASSLLAPAAQYSGSELLLRSRSTLGETLEGTPGVSSTYFGPNASRPVIRGLEGDRVHILSNGGGTADLSGLSNDHAVAADPLTVERIEVLRGPGALLYGGNAAGGVVNLIDNRIPREPLFEAQGGITGKVDGSFNSGNHEQAGAALLETGTDRYALHVDAMSRNAADVSVPISLACTRNGVSTWRQHICNSASEAWGGAVGGSLFFDRGYLGASIATTNLRYGTVAEDESQIRMRSNRFALDGEVRDLGGLLQSVKAQISRTEYMHTEFTADVPGTVFRSSANGLRLQARHARLGQLEGEIGVQWQDSNFSADGEEAFAPYSRTGQAALFALEELRQNWGKLTAGARVESVRVTSEGHPTLSRFIAASRSFNPISLALGAVWEVAPAWQLSSNLSANERAPKDYELFADGVHLATHAYETGNLNLTKERSINLDFGAGWKHGAHSASVQLFVNQFSNYISLEATGQKITVNGTDYDSYRYTPVAARFIGAETHANLRVLDGAHVLDLLLRADSVRADNTDSGQPLPRIAPVRLGATLQGSSGPWSARLGVDQIAAQNRVPDGQTPTAGYTLWHAAVTRRARQGGANLLWYLRLDNAGDALAYSASSILTQTAPGKSPLPGRSLKVGLQANF